MNRRFREGVLPALFMLLLLMPVAAPAASEKVMIAGAGVRVRDCPDPSGRETGRLVLGTVLEKTGISTGTTRVGNREGAWVQVNLPGHGSGWVFEPLTRLIAEGGETEARLALARERASQDEASNNDWLELFRFLDVPRLVPAPADQRAEWMLLRLEALGHFLETTPFFGRSSREPPEEIPPEWRDQIIFNEPAGQWLVQPERFWDLLKIPGLSEAWRDRLAWTSSQQRVPGETEGYLPAVLNWWLSTEARYLALFPRGTWCDQALKKINEGMPWDAPAKPDQIGDFMPEDKPGLRDAISRLKAIVAATPDGRSRRGVLKKLDALAECIK